MSKKMLWIALTIIALLIIAILLVAALYIQSQMSMRDLAARIAALETANRNSLNCMTADEIMAASYALNLFRNQVELLDNANVHLSRAMNTERTAKTKKQATP